MEFLFFAIALAFGGFFGALTLAQGLIILRFGLPTAIRWYRVGWLTAVWPASRYLLSLVFLAGLFAIVTWVMLRFFPAHKVGYFVGLGMALLYVVGKSGATNDNIADFVRSNLAYINESELDSLINKLGVADKLKGDAPRVPQG